MIKKSVALGWIALFYGLAGAPSCAALEAIVGPVQTEGVRPPAINCPNLSGPDLGQKTPGSAGSRQPLILATFAEQESDLARIQIMIESIRTFAGRFKDVPVWVYLTEGLLASESEYLERIESLEGEFWLGQAPEEATWYYLSRKVFASAQAEEEAEGKADILAWLDVDTVFLQEPGEFLLPQGKSLGYRPVMHRNISPLYDEPLDDFWKRAYEKMSVPESRAFPMLTVADEDRIRPYFNAG